MSYLSKPSRQAWPCLGLLLALLLQSALPALASEDVHIAYLTDCSMYSDWQTVGMAFSYKMSQQPGAITRVMCCKDEERQRYNQQLLNLMPTHVAPSFAIRNEDNYAAYNKPGAVVDWLKHMYPNEHWVLVIDSDMLLRKVFRPKDFNASQGWAVSADYRYLIGVMNDLWKNHIPQVAARNDTLAGPYGRHADQVGGFFFIHRDDLSKMAPWWLSITEDVRQDKDAWRLSGDQYVEKGGKPWISEMYGYVYAAAKMDVWHKWDLTCMHYPTYVPADCTYYSDWQSVGMIFSFRMSGQPGSVGRVMCCSDVERKNYDATLLKEVDTWVAPSFAVHPRTGDHYAAYNKPEAVIDWLEHQTPKEDFVLVLDSDMILRKPFLVEAMHPKKGSAVGAKYTYMIGVANELADRHIPEIDKRNDTRAGPFGRRADQVGGFFFVHRDDLKRMSKLWLKYTEDVRADKEAYRLSGDVYAIHPGDKPWISEMYGYAFGAAKADVWHDWDSESMIYPQYEPRGVPKLMHYGLLFEVNKYKFDKHWHYDFDVTKCPPWDLSNPQRTTGGIFPPPPRPSELTNKHLSEYYRDLLSIETVATLNAGFCDYHLRHCSPSQQLYDVCKEAIDLYLETQEAVAEAEAKIQCRDWEARCPEWAKSGECTNNPDFMAANCAKSCNKCDALKFNIKKNKPTEALDALAKLKEMFGGGSKSGSATSTSAEKASSSEATKAAEVQHSPETVVVAESPSPSPPPPEHSPPPPKIVNKVRKDFLMRCYRMALSLDEVKDCVAAARQGIEYQPRKITGDATTTTTADSTSSGSGGEGEKLHVSGSDGEVATNKRKLTDGQEVGNHDEDDLSLTHQDVKAPSGSQGRVLHGARAAISGMSTTQAVVLWVVVLAVALFAVPRLIRMRRRPRSGMRSE